MPSYDQQYDQPYSQHYLLHHSLNFESTPFSPEDLASPEALAATIAAEVIREVRLTRADWACLRGLPWGVPLDFWAERGVPLLQVRRGESRHPVVFVERGGRRYAIKETSPRAAAHEAEVLRALRRRGIPAIEPAGTLVLQGEVIPAGTVAGVSVYESGDMGYLITRLAERVLPQSLLYRYPFTVENKRLLWNAVVALLLRLHDMGVFWGDPSLANILVEFRGSQVRAILADAETAEIYPAPAPARTRARTRARLARGGLSEGLRRQDLDTLAESLIWQAEDIRQARGLPEEAALVTEEDIAEIEHRYAGLRAEHTTVRSAASLGRQGEGVAAGTLADALADTLTTRLRGVEGRIQRLASLGFGLRTLRWQPSTVSGTKSGGRAGRAWRATHPEARLATVPPGADETEITAGILRPTWYTQRVRELIGEDVPRAYAWRLHYHINIHKWLMSERAGYDVGIEAAVSDWQARVHEPLQAFLRAYLPEVAGSAERYAAEAAILDRGWQLSQAEAERPVPIEEAALDFALEDARAALGDDPRENPDESERREPATAAV